MTLNGGIRTEEVRDCLFCKIQGAPLYSGLRDHLFGAPGQWGFLQCANCGLAWLNPVPVAADLAKVYSTYYTHVGNGNRGRGPSWLADIRKKSKGGLYAFVSGCSGLADGWVWRQLGRLLSWVPLLKERAFMGTMCLGPADGKRLLDLGCGDGSFLAMMRDAGWHVTGIDPDAKAARMAQERFGLSVIVGSLHDAGFPNQSFDAVTLSHVIEHVHDPVALLSECRRILKPGGRAVIVTPNIRSLGHGKFRSFWRGLEPPRHFHLFSLETLQTCCNEVGLCVEQARTSSRTALRVWQESKPTNENPNSSNGTRGLWDRLRGMYFSLQEDALCRGAKHVGEEIVVIVSVVP